jgi:hypothetical protein
MVWLWEKICIKIIQSNDKKHRKEEWWINKKIKTQNAVQESFNSPNKKLSESSSMHIVYVNLSLNSTTKRIAGRPKYKFPKTSLKQIIKLTHCKEKQIIKTWNIYKIYWHYSYNAYPTIHTYEALTLTRTRHEQG